MSTYRDRLERTAERYKQLQRNHPRQAWGPVKDGHANLPNTAEVMVVLRSAGELYESDAVQAGLHYLATRVFIHPRPMNEEGGRWPLTRFLVYGLLGLTQWRQWSEDRVPRSSSRLPEHVTVHDAVLHCAEWLRTHRVGNGWPDRADAPQCSILQTATAVIALDRVGMLADEVAAARDLLAKIQSRRDGSWPEQVRGPAHRGEGSPPHTALAVLALARGSAEHHRHAERGRDWLLANSTRWARKTHPERHEGVEAWLHMTFALGLRACLSTGTDPLSSDLRPTIDFLDELWADDENEWRGGEEDRPSVHATHAVVLAYEELRKSQRRIDPLMLFRLVRAGAKARVTSDRALRLKVESDSSILIQDAESGATFGPVDLGDRSCRLVARLVSQSIEADPLAPVPLKALEDLTKDPRAMIRRINGRVRAATDGRVAKLVRVPRGGTTCALTVPSAKVPISRAD